MSTGEHQHERDDPGKSPGGIRIRSILMVPVGVAVGWMVAQLPGAVIGGILGVFLWRSRT